MRRPLALFALVLLGCGSPADVPDTGSTADAGRPDAGPLDAGARDAGADAGFDRTTLPACTLAGARVDLSLAPLLGSGEPLSPEEALARRAVYVLFVLGRERSALDALAADTAVAPLAAAREASLRDAAATCGGDVPCLRAGVALAAGEVAAGISGTRSALDRAGLTTEVAAALRASHLYELEGALSDAALLEAALASALAALASALDEYALGELTPAALATLVTEVADGAAPGSLAWWAPLERTALAGMLRAGRDEGVRYEPLDTGENAAALAALASVDFAAFPYAALLVPGQGPTDPDTVLHPNSAQRADLAAARWRAGLAPVVVVSGGHVHPDRTRYSEAVEMRRYLLEMHGLPESAVLLDPYARHTTTNLRDVTRVLLRAGVPTDARVLVVTDLFQTLYIRDPGFEARCDEELGFLPYDALEALSPTDTCMTLTPLSLTADAADWLDP